MKRFNAIGVFIVSAIVLSACSSPLMRSTEQGVGKVEAEASNANTSLRRGETVVSTMQRDPVQRVNRPWLPVSKVDTSVDPRVGAILGRNVTVNRDMGSIDEAAFYISSLVGVSVAVDPAARELAGGSRKSYRE